MLVILTTAVLSAFVGLTLAANGIVWLITQGVKRAYNAVTAASAVPVPQHKILKNKSQST
jgi:hypothetical protein